MFDICSKELVDVVFPASHEEALALTKRRNFFEGSGIKIATSKYDVLEEAYDKKKAYMKLARNGLPCPEFYSVKNIKEFEDAAAKLGIERKKIVMKPSLARGGRGTRILTKENTVKYLLDCKPGFLEANYDETLRALRTISSEDFPEIILMEYLPGTLYSIDFLAKGGEPLAIIPKMRIVGNPSQTLVGKVIRDESIEKSIREISRLFRFDYNVNIEMGCNEEGVALPYDINPRIASSTGFCTAAGANLIYYALKMALGEDIPKIEFKDNVMMLRYFEEFYVSEGRVMNV